MMFVSFNVNSIRTRLHQLEAVIDSLNPDFIGLQETKVTDEEFPEDAIRELGYHVHFHGQKTHYGVALLSRQAPDSPVKFPAKEKFYADLMRYLDDLKAANGEIVVMGDMNISPTDQDIGIGADNAKRWLRTGKCSFLPEEREWLGQVESRGFTDVFRHLHPEESDTFSWFDYRSKGFDRDPRRGLRIDLIMASDPLLPKAEEAGVSYDIRAMERPSDHCPVWARFSL